MRKKTVLGVVAFLLFAAAGAMFYGEYRSKEPKVGGDGPVGRSTAKAVDGKKKSARIRNNILPCELIRQALFLAEREECKLPTRDASLGELPPQAPDPARRFTADAFLRGYDGLQVRLFKNDAAAPAEWRVGIPASKPGDLVVQDLLPNPHVGEEIDHGRLLEGAEALSRGKFKAALSEASKTSAPAPAGTPDEQPAVWELPPEVEQRLGEMNFISQFAAVRQVHRAIRTRGESPQSLGALARGYANLGQLTSFEWTPAFKAFTARSLLYAQRAVVKWPNATEPLRHRAYAWALAGFQGAALNDLDQANALEKKNGAPLTKSPPWLSLLGPYCRYETAELADLAAGDQDIAPLALLLCFLTVERCNSQAVTNGYGEAMLHDSPDCLRVIDAMVLASGVSQNHKLTLAGPAALAFSIAERMRNIADLPQAVKDAIESAKGQQFDPNSAAAVPATLLSASGQDTAEPSWAVLGALIREAQFVQVQQRAKFMAEDWGVDAGDFVVATLPLYKDHPYRQLIESYVPDRSGAAKSASVWATASGHLINSQPTLALTPLLFKLEAAKVRPPDKLRSFWNWQGHYYDLCAIDLETEFTTRVIERDALEAHFIDSLKAVSPYAPICVAEMIRMQWDNNQDQVPEWERRFGTHPTVSAALGKKYTQLKQWDRAEKFLNNYLKVAPDQWAFEMLAGNYLAQNDEANWLKTLKRSLEQPDYGLDHARTNQVIAQHFMSNRQWKAALPYAEAAASSYSNWGLQTAASCYEGLGDFNHAESVLRAAAERYNDPYDYFEWCVRTGHGDRQWADPAVKAFLYSDPAGSDPADLLIKRFLYHFVKGEMTAAAEDLQERGRTVDDPWDALHLALIQDANRDSAARNASLRRAANGDPDSPQAAAPLSALARLMVASFGSDDSPKLDLTAVDALIGQTASPRHRINTSYFVARFLALHGDDASALKFMKAAAAGSQTQRINCILATVDLRARGIDTTQFFAVHEGPEE